MENRKKKRTEKGEFWENQEVLTAGDVWLGSVGLRGAPLLFGYYNGILVEVI